jgi:hypothetical protein
MRAIRTTMPILLTILAMAAAAGPARAAAEAPPDQTAVLLAAVEAGVPGQAEAALKSVDVKGLSETERARALAAAASLHDRRPALYSRLATARFMASLGDPRGFDWAVESLQAFLDDGQLSMMLCTNEYIGETGEVVKIFSDFDRPAFANFLRLAAKGNQPKVLRIVARSLASHDNHGYAVVPVDPASDSAKALRDGLAAIPGDLAKELAGMILTPPSEPKRFPGLTEAQAKEILAAKATEKDFVVEPFREPFAKTDAITIRVRKTTPGLFACSGCSTSISYPTPPPTSTTNSSGTRVLGVSGGMTIFSGGSPWITPVGQGGTVNSFPYSPPKSPDLATADVKVTFTFQLLDGGTLDVSATFKPEQLRLDPARDIDELLRRLASADPRDVTSVTEMIDRFRFTSSGADKIPITGEDKKRLIQALLKRLREAAMEEPMQPNDRPPPLDIAEAPHLGAPMMNCHTALSALGLKDVPAAELEPLLAAKDFWAARWAYDEIRLKYLRGEDGPKPPPDIGQAPAAPPTPNSDDYAVLQAARHQTSAAAEERLITLLRANLRSEDACTARNAAALLRHGSFYEKHDGSWLVDVILETTDKRRPSAVRTAGALLGGLNKKFPAYDGAIVQFLGPLVDDADDNVAAAAMIGLAEAVSNSQLVHKGTLAIFERLVARNDPDRMKAVVTALEEIDDPAFVPLRYQAIKATGHDRGSVNRPLDAAATGSLLDRLAADPRDGVALTMLLSAGYVWPPDTPVGRLQQLVREHGPSDAAMPIEGAVARLLRGDTPAGLVSDFRKHLKSGNYTTAAQDVLALAALGHTADAPVDELLAAPDGWWKPGLANIVTAAAVAKAPGV